MTLLDDILSRQITQDGELSLVTSVLGASASWYGHSLIAKALSAGDAVIHISFVHETTFHGECLRKLGTDLALFARKGRYVFVDGLSALFYQQPGSRKGASLSFTGGALDLQRLSADIQTRIKKAVSLQPDGTKTRLIIENPDMLLAAGGLSSLDLINELLDWHEVCSRNFKPPRKC